MTTEVTDNILYMKLLHELKAAFPAVSDDSVRQCISQYGKDKSRCIEYLSHETDRIQHGHYGRYNQQRKFSLQALLNHQMEQCMKLERELSMARHEVQEVKGDVIELEKKLNMNQLLTQGKISAEVIEQEITDLRQACDSMAEEVTKLTKGTVPLGETSIEFYESLPAALEEHEGSCPRFDVQRGGSRNDLGRRSNPNLVEASQGLVEEKQWSCSACTFLNHPALKNCEECDMPRIILDANSARGMTCILQQSVS